MKQPRFQTSTKPPWPLLPFIGGGGAGLFEQAAEVEEMLVAGRTFGEGDARRLAHVPLIAVWGHLMERMGVEQTC